ncbi:MAG: ATP-binding protein [Actinobacteria bacterium]|nr:ATP-binding protein [Actinomycetota bacterium]
MRIRTKVSISHILIVLFSLALLAAMLASRVEDLFMTNLKDELRKQAFGIAAVIKAGNRGEDELQPLVKSLGVRFGSRITLVDISGKVLADSESEPQTMENHAGRSEIRRALAGGFGEDLRKSATLDRRMLYVAAPVEPLAGRNMVVRVAVPTTKVDDTLRDIPLAAGASFIAIGAIATAVSVLLTRTLTGPISRMTTFAKNLSEGELFKRANVRSRDELGELSDSLNRMAASLEGNVQELSTEKKKLELIVDHIADAIFLLNGRGEVVFANPAAQKILRLPGDKIVGRRFESIADSPEIERVVSESISKQSAGELKIEIRLPRKRHLKVTALPLLENKAVIGSLVIAQDETRQQRLDKMRRDFVANVSHELKTPITGLKLLGETLARSMEDDKEAALHFAHKISTDMSRLSRLVDDLLILSRLEAPEKKPERLPVSLGEIVQEVVQSFTHLASEKGIELSAEIEKDLPSITGDPSLLRTLVENLVENAVKYTAKGSVRVGVLKDGSKVVLSVRDTGPGIAEADLPRIFERFYRVDKDRSRATGGTGLGLSIAKHIAENHSARIRVVSSQDSGSIFRVEFPSNQG